PADKRSSNQSEDSWRFVKRYKCTLKADCVSLHLLARFKLRKGLVLTSSTLLLLLCVWVTLSQSSPLRCCTKYSSHPLPFLRLKDFTLQDTTMICNIDAVIFTTVKNRQICANPNDPWVQKAISHIQNTRNSV
ncbi:C-C motif chemokine 4-like, partial [Myxocyprinus asiaticus]|uniref:C-C motif chemokine 4-like n=1 Tax=Myxocyprinus asiaticus TaxID=70543 RepID=UPI002223CD47